MKGLNIKRIAAIGLGAALVGSALAPAVMAAGGYSNLDSALTKKTDIISATGSPLVDVVVGTIGQPADVIWAGNIAAKVAQMATVPVGGSTGTKTVDFTVGGTVSEEGQGRLSEQKINLTDSSVDFTGMEVTSTKMPSLVNDNSVDWKINNTKVQVAIKENLTADNVDVYAQADNGSSAYAFNETVAAVPAGALKYNVDLSDTPIEADQTAMDSNSKVDITIPWLGKTYVVDEVASDGKSLIMYSDTLPTELKIGDKLSVSSTTAYAGKSVEVQLVDLINTGETDQPYEAKWAVLVDGVVKDYYQETPAASVDLKDAFDADYFTDTITVSSAGQNLGAGTFTATVRTGADRLELVSGEGYPFTDEPKVDDKAEWKVTITTNGSDAITNIALENQWAFTRDSGSEGDKSKHVLKQGEEIKFPSDFAKFKFVGWQDKARRTVTLGSDAISFTDLGGNAVEVPYYADFTLSDSNVGVIEVAGKEFTFGATGANKFYWEEGNIDTDDPTSLENGPFDYNAAVANVAAGAGVDVASLDLGLENDAGTTVDVNYNFTRVGENAAIVLNAQEFNLYTDDAYTPTLSFVDTNNGGAGVGYYLPNMNDFEQVVTGYTNDSDTYMAAKFLYEDKDSTDVTIYMESDQAAKAWDSDSIGDMTDITMYGPGYDAIVGTWKLSANEDDLKTLATNDGSTVTKDGSEFVISVPEEYDLVEAYLGATDTTTSTTGGASYPGVAVGETKGGVTVTAISGATTGVSIVPVSNLVKADSASTAGKSILVGGWMANTKVAADLVLPNGTKLNEALVSSGDYVDAVLDSGNILVAGWSKEDTATAAQALIAALDALQ